MNPELVAALLRAGFITEEQAEALRNLDDQPGSTLNDLDAELAEVIGEQNAVVTAEDSSEADTEEAVEAMSLAASALDAVRAERVRRPNPNTVASDLVRRLDADQRRPADRPTIASIAARSPNDHRPRPRRRNPQGIGDAEIMLASGARGGPAELTEAMIRTYREAQGEGRHHVASLTIEAPEERTLGGDSLENARRIDAVTSPAAITAAGGICAPIGVRYEIDSTGTTDRPVVGAMAEFVADRGGVRFNEPPQLADATGAVSVWTVADDVAAGEPEGPTKNCLAVPCGDEVEVLVHSVPRCLEFGNLNARTHPEVVTGWLRAAMASQARLAENTLLAAIEAGSTAVTTAQVLGAARDLLVAVDQAAAAYRHRARIGDRTRLRAVFPAWARALIRSDIARQIPGDQAIAVTDEQIASWFGARGINVSFHVDGDGFDAQAAGPLVGFPATVEWGLFAEGSWLYLNGGVLDLGIVRDAESNRRNSFQVFAETFEGAAYVGDAGSFWVTSTTSPTGATAATI